MKPLIESPLMALAVLFFGMAFVAAVAKAVEWHDRRRELMKPDRWPKVGGNPQDMQ
jgi:hypothetical protein